MAKEIGELVAAQVTKKVVGVAATAAHVPVVIRSLRVLGVYVCASAECDLGHCKCLQDLLKTELPDRVKEAADEKVKRVLDDAWREVTKRRWSAA